MFAGCWVWAATFKVTPKFRILRAKVNLQFKRAEARLTDGGEGAGNWKETLETEYQQFLETVRSWQDLQRERVQRTRQSLQEKWDNAAWRTRMRELEYRLKMQRKRLRTMVAAIAAT